MERIEGGRMDGLPDTGNGGEEILDDPPQFVTAKPLKSRPNLVHDRA